MRSWRAAMVELWDWWVYRRATASFRRIFERNPGTGYLVELRLRHWNEQHPLSPELRAATERFHEELLRHTGGNL